MAEPTSCCVVAGTYCARVDALFNHHGVHLIDVSWRGDQLSLTVEPPGPGGLPWLWSRRRRPWAQAAATARHPGVRCAGGAVVASPPLPLH